MENLISDDLDLNSFDNESDSDSDNESEKLNSNQLLEIS